MGIPVKNPISRDEALLQSGSAEDYYLELTNRNRHFVPAEVQKRLRQLRVLVAGCGAAGGACTAPLARLGVTHFRLADNGSYEITNLNRQHAFVDRIGENKAEFHASELLRINPYLDLQAFPEGVTRENLPALVEWADLIIDAVDVTNPVSIGLKFHLHEVAHARRKPVLSPLDPGLTQYGQTYDYRDEKVKPLNGQLDACKRAQHPIKALFTMFSVEDLPAHTLQLVVDLCEHPEMPASQMGASADLLSGVMAAAVLRFADDGALIPGWHLTVAPYAYSPRRRLVQWFNSFRLRRQLKKLLKALP